MIWHELICDGCAKGFAGAGLSMAREWRRAARKDGWIRFRRPDGVLVDFCPRCVCFDRHCTGHIECSSHSFCEKLDMVKQ